MYVYVYVCTHTNDTSCRASRTCTEYLAKRFTEELLMRMVYWYTEVETGLELVVEKQKLRRKEKRKLFFSPVRSMTAWIVCDYLIMLLHKMTNVHV